MKPTTRRRTTLSVPIVLAALLIASSCKDENDGGACVDNATYFKEEIWVPILSQNCIQCHTTTGAAKDSDFILVTSDWGPDWLERNMEVVEEIAKRTYEGESWLVLKPTNTIEHGGGERISVGSEEYERFKTLIERIEDPVVCEDDGAAEADFFEGVVLLDEVATLRKASLSLVGRLPTETEEQRVRDGGFEALDAVLDEMMQTDAFYSRIEEIYNDYFLTDRYLSSGNGTPAIDLLDPEDYPNAYWFEDLPEGEYEVAARFANDAVAREALKLVSYVVKQGRPFSEILTADYMVVNPFSAKVYGVNASFEDEYDPNEWVEARLPGIPHAGVLSSHMMMNRFPTTPTNRNRHRSRKVFEFFLATDVQRLGDRPIDPTNIQDFNPTMNNPNCTLCHAIIDPVAGTFQNWDELGRYRPPEGGWFTDMRPPGFGDEVLPADQFDAGLPWLAQQIVQDPRFAASVVHIMFKGLSGQDPLREPTDTSAEDYLARVRAFEVQSEIFGEIANKFRDSDYDLRVVIKEIVKTPYYRAANAEPLDETRALELAEVGTGRLLTPEQLHRKIQAVTGYPWRRDADSDDYLLDLDWYRIFYGGIDSDTVVTRITEPNGIMANVAARMANEVSCWTTARDFVLPPAERRLFPFVEVSFEPEDENGFEVPAAAQAIRTNIQYLHQRMLGEYLELNDPEINRTYELFLSVWKDGRKGLADDTYDDFLPFQCRAIDDYWTGQELPDIQKIERDDRYTIRAWMAVMTYLMMDYRFLHE